MSGTGTTPAFSGNQATSSTPDQNYPGQQYTGCPAANGQGTPSNESKNGLEVLNLVITVGGIIFAAIASYFFTLMAVKDDISTNRENTSNLQTELNHQNSTLQDIKSSIAKFENLNSMVIRLDEKFKNLNEKFTENNKKTNK